MRYIVFADLTPPGHPVQSDMIECEVSIEIRVRRTLGVFAKLELMDNTFKRDAEEKLQREFERISKEYLQKLKSINA